MFIKSWVGSRLMGKIQYQTHDIFIDFFLSVSFFFVHTFLPIEMIDQVVKSQLEQNILCFLKNPNWIFFQDIILNEKIFVLELKILFIIFSSNSYTLISEFLFILCPRLVILPDFFQIFPCRGKMLEVRWEAGEKLEGNLLKYNQIVNILPQLSPARMKPRIERPRSSVD